MSGVFPSTAQVVDSFGLVAASTATAPLRFAPVKFGDGVFVEEGTTNLITDPSFGIGTLWSTNTGASVVYSTAQAYLGAGSLQLTATATGAISIYLSAGAAATPGQPYAFSFYIFGPSRSITADFDWYNGYTFLSSTQATVSATTANSWTRCTVTGTAPASATKGIPVIYVNNAVTGDVWWIDAVQIEQKAYATSYVDGSLGAGYAWTGAANASTSTRAGGALIFPASIAGGAFSMCAWVKAGLASVTAAGNTDATFITLYTDSNNYVRVVQSAGSMLFAKNVAGTPASAFSAFSYAAGDLLFIAGTYDGSTMSVYVSKNAAALVTATQASATALPTLTGAEVGGQTGPINPFGKADSTVEQVLVYNTALTSAEITTLAAATSPTDYATDPRIVFAFGTATTANKAQALTAAGTGLTRPGKLITGGARVDRALDATESNPTGSLTRISVPAGTGLGVGTKVRIDQGIIYRVDSVAATPGADLLYCTAVG